MNRRVICLLFVCAGFAVASRSAAAITIPTVPVGDAGNAGELSGAAAGGGGPTTIVGGVNYNYRIGTTEVTNAQYADFLNAVAATDTYALYNTAMGGSSGGISRSGSSGNYSYATIAGRANLPVNFVSWYDAIRFANWLHNGQGSGDTETGAYMLGEVDGNGTPTNGLSITREADALWFLPSADEWYKAAYYDPTLNDGAGGYWDYPTASDTGPTAESPPGGTNSANYASAVAQLTDAGAYTNSASPYGTFDQGGNVWEWNEALFNPTARGLRGGSLNDSLPNLHARNWIGGIPTGEGSHVGFRVATVPEPSTAVLAILGCAIILCCRKWFKQS